MVSGVAFVVLMCCFAGFRFGCCELPFVAGFDFDLSVVGCGLTHALVWGELFGCDAGLVW